MGHDIGHSPWSGRRDGHRVGPLPLAQQGVGAVEEVLGGQRAVIGQPHTVHVDTALGNGTTSLPRGGDEVSLPQGDADQGQVARDRDDRHLPGDGVERGLRRLDGVAAEEDVGGALGGDRRLLPVDQGGDVVGQGPVGRPGPSARLPGFGVSLPTRCTQTEPTPSSTTRLSRRTATS